MFYKINLYFLLTLLHLTNYRVLTNLKTILQDFKYQLVFNFSSLPTFYNRNELLWVDGFLFDFLQKKSADIFLRKFVIYTGFLFSERLVFDYVIKVYLDNIIWPSHYFSILEPSNVTEMLTYVIYSYFLFFSLLSLIFILLV